MPKDVKIGNLLEAVSDFSANPVGFEHWYLLPVFFFIAVLYSSVGFGGGSSYLAVLAISGVDFRSLRVIALLCNITVVTGGTYIFFRSGYLRLSRSLPLIVASVPLAFLGGRFLLSEEAFFLLLGIVLVSAALLLWFQPARGKSVDDADGKADAGLKTAKEESETKRKSSTKQQAISVFSGGIIGWVSGMVGIGGGIFLSPTLNLMRWDKAKVISATASLYILVNSVAGLLGQSTAASFELDWSLAISLMICVFAGGQVGSRLGAKILPSHIVRKLTAVLVLVVGVNQFLR